MRFNCTRSAVLVSGLVLSLSCHSAFAGDGWRIVDTAGDVTAGSAGFVPVALSNNQTLPADAWVETRATGRAVLARGLESIVVGPNSRVQLPDEEVNGNTQILQTMGSALYRIGKQQKPHFQVDTPYLAAVVKGTSFTVTVDGNDATVSVSEGLVEVSTPDRSDVEFVKPGFKATVSQDRRGEVVVEKRNDGNGQPEGVEPTNGNDADNDASDEHASNQDKGADDVMIATPIGEVELDVKEVSGGLAFGEVKRADIDPSSGEVEGSKDIDKDKASDASSVEVVAVASVSDSTASGVSGGVAAAPDLGSSGSGAVDRNNGSGGGNGNGNGGGVAPDLGGSGVTVPDLGGGNGGGNGNVGGNGGGNGGGGGNGNGNGNGNN